MSDGALGTVGCGCFPFCEARPSMWMFLFLFFMQANPNPCQSSPVLTQSPSLIVQVVDPMWLPVPGAEVTVKPLRGDTQLKSNRTETDKDGYARFFVPSDADY